MRVHVFIKTALFLAFSGAAFGQVVNNGGGGVTPAANLTKLCANGALTCATIDQQGDVSAASFVTNNCGGNCTTGIQFQMYAGSIYKGQSTLTASDNAFGTTWLLPTMAGPGFGFLTAFGVTPTASDCVNILSAGSTGVVLGDAGATCGGSGSYNGSPVNPKTATYQVLAADFSGYKTISVASGTFTITLVASGSQPTNGQYINIVNYGTGVVTVARSGQNINGGVTSLTLAAGSATAPTGATIVSDGTNYFANLYGASGGGSPALSSILAAAGSNTIANGNFPQVWQWAQTTNSQIGFTISESSASTGTADELVQINTFAGSTATPLVVANSLTGSQTFPAFQVDPTWNTTNLVSGAFFMNVTDTASGAGSLLMNLEDNSTSKFKVDKTGLVTTAVAIPFTSGGTGLTSATSGGVPYFNSTTSLASSTAGAAGHLMLWGGAGTAPTDGGAPATGTVTSIATTSPLGGGPITGSGTLTCSTCLVASSPAAGVLHVAGSTQTATSSAVALTDMATQATNTIVMNATGGTAAPTAVAMPTCTSGADLYNTSTNSWSCVTTGGSGSLTGSGLTTGDVYYLNGATLTLAEANASTTVPGICVASSSTVCVYSGAITTGSWTAGGLLYVSDSSAGALTQTAPTASGHYVQIVGIATSTTAILVMPNLSVLGIQ